MWRYIAGGLAALLMVVAGVVLSRSRTSQDSPLPTRPPAMEPMTDNAAAPLPDTAPAATDRTREQKRFDRYDKNRDGIITREEYLASRRKAYAKLDTNHDGTLSFDEWAASTEDKFAKADGDSSGSLNAKEFATTATTHKTTPKVKCPPTSGRDGD